ncbi:hypothetical protein FZEAL_6213 [Fusarium zealandicum]|uniref:RING-type domain-containing protein n=1 Tax=Fusarium zealandicum TaxID=1053134 RepID=A0A8H4XJ18_9HYPO|nr:hypothetical protein FZEAL_6213 [Fusarium zealandicum]
MSSSTITETFWPVLRDAMKGDPSRRMFLKCPICNERMSTTTKGLKHDASILRCGHMACHGCIDGGRPRCPVCRLSLAHHLCGHSQNGCLMPASVQHFDLVPLTKADGGGTLTPYCDDCQQFNLLQGLSLILESLDTNETGLPDFQFLGLTAYCGDYTVPLVETENVKVRRVEIPEYMTEIVRETLARFNSRSRANWCNWEADPVTIRCHLYEEPTRQGIRKRFANKLRKLVNKR